jgi:hypothetical protein
MSNKLSIKILETKSSRERFNFYVLKYRNEGWEVLSSKRSRAKMYKLDYQFSIKDQLFIVLLKGCNGEREYVGAFSKKDEMDKFIERNYPNINHIDKIRYARNRSSTDLFRRYRMEDALSGSGTSQEPL